MANIKNSSNQSSTQITFEKKERNWTMKLIDKVLDRKPDAVNVVITTTCLKSVASKNIVGSLDTIATLLQDGVIKSFAVGNQHEIEKQVFVDGKPVYENNKPKTEPKIAYSIKLFGLDISKESIRSVYDENGNKTEETTTFRWFSRLYKELQEQKTFEAEFDCEDCFDGVVDEV